MDEGETDQLMGGQWAETEKGGGGSLNTSLLFKCFGNPRTGKAIIGIRNHHNLKLNLHA